METQYRILLVEDEPLIQMLIVDVLSEIGIGVSNAVTTAAEALELIERFGFDAAVVDCTLSDGRCEPVAAALTEKSVPFIIVTGHSPEEIEARFPGIRIVPKPFITAELEAAVQELLPALA